MTLDSILVPPSFALYQPLLPSPSFDVTSVVTCHDTGIYCSSVIIYGTGRIHGGEEKIAVFISGS